MTISEIAWAVFTGAEDPEPDPPCLALFELDDDTREGTRHDRPEE